MPIKAKAQGKTFTFPDGTDQAQIGVAIDEFFSQQGGQPIPASDDATPPVQAPIQQPTGQGRNRRRVEPQPFEVPQGPLEPSLGPTKGQRAGVVQSQRRKESEVRDQALFEQFETGEISSKDLNAEEKLISHI